MKTQQITERFLSFKREVLLQWLEDEVNVEKKRDLKNVLDKVFNGETEKVTLSEQEHLLTIMKETLTNDKSQFLLFATPEVVKAIKFFRYANNQASADELVDLIVKRYEACGKSDKGNAIALKESLQFNGVMHFNFEESDFTRPEYWEISELLLQIAEISNNVTHVRIINLTNQQADCIVDVIKRNKGTLKEFDIRASHWLDEKRVAKINDALETTTAFESKQSEINWVDCVVNLVPKEEKDRKFDWGVLDEMEADVTAGVNRLSFTERFSAQRGAATGASRS